MYPLIASCDAVKLSDSSLIISLNSEYQQYLVLYKYSNKLFHLNTISLLNNSPRAFFCLLCVSIWLIYDDCMWLLMIMVMIVWRLFLDCFDYLFQSIVIKHFG